MLRLHVRFPLRLHWFILCTRRSRGTAHEGGGCDQSIGSIVSDAIVRSCLWLTATRSSPFGCFSTLLQVVDNWPHIFCGSRFSTGRLLAIEDFTFFCKWIILVLAVELTLIDLTEYDFYWKYQVLSHGQRIRLKLRVLQIIWRHNVLNRLKECERAPPPCRTSHTAWLLFSC